LEAVDERPIGDIVDRLTFFRNAPEAYVAVQVRLLPMQCR
jgi:hypothetical protein